MLEKENWKTYEEYSQIAKDIYQAIVDTGEIPQEYINTDDPNIQVCMMESILISMCPDVEVDREDKQDKQFLEPDISPFIPFLNSESFSVRNISLVAIAHTANHYDADSEVLQRVFLNAASDPNRHVRRQCAGALMLVSKEKAPLYSNAIIPIVKILSESKSSEQRRYSAKLVDKYWEHLENPEKLFPQMFEDKSSEVRTEWSHLLPNLVNKYSKKEIFDLYSSHTCKEAQISLMAMLAVDRELVRDNHEVKKKILDNLSHYEDPRIYNANLFVVSTVLSPLDIEYSRTMLKLKNSSDPKIRKAINMSMKIDWNPKMEMLFAYDESHLKALETLNLLIEDDDPEVRTEAVKIMEEYIKRIEENKRREERKAMIPKGKQLSLPNYEEGNTV